MLMERLGQTNEAVKDAREFKDRGFSFTRRTIALASVASIVVAPILGVLLIPDLPVSYGFSETFSGWFSYADTITWTTGTGIVITPIHSHLVYAIAGMYFGSSSVK